MKRTRACAGVLVKRQYAAKTMYISYNLMHNIATAIPLIPQSVHIWLRYCQNQSWKSSKACIRLAWLDKNSCSGDP